MMLLLERNHDPDYSGASLEWERQIRLHPAWRLRVFGYLLEPVTGPPWETSIETALPNNRGTVHNPRVPVPAR